VLASRVWSTLTNCLDDYTVDSRGDVGSWIRIAACDSLVPVYKYVTLDVKMAIGKLLRLSVERMDRVRVVAGKTLRSIVSQAGVEIGLKEFITEYFHLGF
jgi:tubulin-specific chaperone D